MPIVFAASALAIVLNQVITDPEESLFGLGFVLLGVPVYWIWTNRREETRA